MGDHYQLLIRNGTLIDGSGNSRRRADVAARDGRIAAIGRLDGATADVVIDAQDRIVAPGIIDPHTHYDPQITWDPYATASCYHGVTTVRFVLPPGVTPEDLPLPVGVSSVVRGGSVEFAVDEPTRVLRDLADWALGRGEELAGLTVLRPSLEDVYLALTGDGGS